MDNKKISIHNRNLKTRLSKLKDWKIPEEDKKDLPKFLKDLELGKVTGKYVGNSRKIKYLDMLKPILLFFNKPTSKLTAKDIDKLALAINNNKIKRKDGKAYSLVSKEDLREMARNYINWKINNEEAVRVLRVKKPRKTPTPDSLTEAQVEKLFKACKTAKQRFIIAVLFDLGARIEEFLNIRYEDIQEPTAGFPYYKIELKEEYSKTEGRNIGLYWKHSTETIREFIQDLEKKSVNQLKKPVITDSYDSIRMFLTRLGKKVLKRRVHPHLFRHTSATHYADKMNRQQLCVRFGWRFSSRMPDIYIKRKGVEEAKLADKFSGTEVEELRTKVDKLESLLYLTLKHGKNKLDEIKAKV